MAMNPLFKEIVQVKKILSALIIVLLNSSINHTFAAATMVNSLDYPISKDILDNVRKGVTWIEVMSHADGQENSWGGTGFLVDKERGIYVTNHHVVGNEFPVCTYSMTFENGMSTTAKLLDFHPFYDIAFLQVDPTHIPALTEQLNFREEFVSVNEKIYTLGNGSQELFSVQEGRVFAPNMHFGPFPQQSFFFTGNVTHGASGSPVFDNQGRVMGLLFGGNQGTGSALAIHGIYVRQMLESILTKSSFDYYTLGVLPRYEHAQTCILQGVLPEEMKNELKPNLPLLMVDSLIPGTSAYNALKPGDIIWGIGDRVPMDHMFIMDILVANNYDREIPVEIYRAGQKMTVSLRPSLVRKDLMKTFVSFAGATWLDRGDVLDSITGDDSPGVYITSAKFNSPFSKVALNRMLYGHYSLVPTKITHINNIPITNLKVLQEIIPLLMFKKSFSVRYINFYGRPTIESMVIGLNGKESPASTSPYFTTFDTPKLYQFDFNNHDWKVKALGNNN
jgi:S1-C subfamily serine protease